MVYREEAVREALVQVVGYDNGLRGVVVLTGPVEVAFGGSDSVDIVFSDERGS